MMTDLQLVADETERPERRPGGDPLALRLFATLRARPVVDLAYVYAQLQRRFADTPDDEMRAWCRDAMRACLEEKKKISCAVYDDWWNKLEDRSAWPSSNQIRTTFGGWQAAREEIEPRGRCDVPSRRLRRTPKTTNEGLVLTLQTWGASFGRRARAEELTTTRYYRWAEQARTDPRYFHLALPLGFSAFQRHFGSWAAALRTAGLLCAMRTSVHDPVRHFDELSDDDFVALLREAAGPGATDLRRKTFEEFVESRNATRPAGDELPNSRHVERRFGSWVAALTRAGIVPEAGARKRSRRRKKPITRTFALECMMRALEERGELNRRSYRGWRDEEIEEHGWGDHTPPSDNWFDGEFGKFDKAVAEAAALLATVRRAAA